MAKQRITLNNNKILLISSLNINDFRTLSKNCKVIKTKPYYTRMGNLIIFHYTKFPQINKSMRLHTRISIYKFYLSINHKTVKSIL